LCENYSLYYSYEYVKKEHPRYGEACEPYKVPLQEAIVKMADILY